MLPQNAAIDASNRGLVAADVAVAAQVARVRHTACQLLHAARPTLLQDAQQVQLLAFCLRASDAWAELGMWEQSEVVLGHAASALGPVCLQPLQARSAASGAGSLSPAKAEQLVGLMFDVQLARFTTAMKLKQQVCGGTHGRSDCDACQQAGAPLGENVCLQRVSCGWLAATAAGASGWVQHAVCLRSLPWLRLELVATCL